MFGYEGILSFRYLGVFVGYLRNAYLDICASGITGPKFGAEFDRTQTSQSFLDVRMLSRLGVEIA